jgi:hypothetical protein
LFKYVAEKAPQSSLRGQALLKLGVIYHFGGENSIKPESPDFELPSEEEPVRKQIDVNLTEA